MTSTLTSQELRTLARGGAVVELRNIERQLATLHKVWPELFLSRTTPQLLAASLKTNGNGHHHWPAVLRSTRTPRPRRRKSPTPPTPAPAARKRVVWTAAMRRDAAARMAARHRDPAFKAALARARATAKKRR